jgi:hypothetical protein
MYATGRPVTSALDQSLGQRAFWSSDFRIDFGSQPARQRPGLTRARAITLGAVHELVASQT